MFGSSGGTEHKDSQGDSAVATEDPADTKTAGNTVRQAEEGGSDKRNEKESRPLSTGDDGTAEKKRRSGGVTSKASSLLASAKDSLSFSKSSSKTAAHPESPTQTPMQKLGKQDPALIVPQGHHNNSAGESSPGLRSTFKVGVWEDKNKKCRRTMEDTHAFLYNFLHTPAPTIPESTNQAESSSKEANPADSESGASSPASMMETDNGYFAIFDGHAGTFAADWCGKKLHIILEDTIRKNPNTPIPELLDQTFTTVDAQLEKLPVKNSGCTAVAAVLRWEDRIPNSQSATGSTAIAPATLAAVKAAEESPKGDEAAADSGIDMSKSPNQQTPAMTPTAVPALGETHAKLKSTASRHRVLYTANVGDARIVLCRNGKALRLSYDHKGSDENEGKRITNAGGLILHNRVNGVLAVTRALGDSYMKDLVTGHPYTTETVIQPDLDEFIILACDGLWDVCSDQEACDLVRNDHDPTEAAKKLVEYALARFSTDNLSCMIVRFNRPVLVATAQNSTAAIGVEGDPNSHAGKISEVEKIVGEAKRKAASESHPSERKTTGSGSESTWMDGSHSEESMATSKQSSMERVEEEEPAQGSTKETTPESTDVELAAPSNPKLDAVSDETIENMKLPDPIARQASRNQ